MDCALKWFPKRSQFVLVVLLCGISSFSFLPLSPAQEKPAEEKKEPKTTKNLEIPTDELGLMVKPLTLEELEIEVGAWMGELQKLATEISNLEIAIKQQKTAIAKDETAASKLEDANQALKEAQEALTKANESNDAQAIEAANQKLQEATQAQADAQKAVEEAKQAAESQSNEVKEAAQSALNEKAEEAQKKAEEAQQTGNSEDAQKAQEEAQKAQEAAQGNAPNNSDNASAEAKKEDAQKKAEAKDTLTEVKTEKTIARGGLIERVQIVLDAYALKGGDPAPHQLYIDAVKGINIDVTDASATYTLIKTWIASEDGGIKWAINIGKFIAILIGFWLAAIILGRITQRAIKMSKKVSNLLGDFLNKFVRRIVLLIGFVIGLSALGVDIGPLLAAMGAAGFVIGFALQGSLSNFASGIMILMYRPFDVGDVVEAGGVAGKVESTSLFTTHIRTPDNKALIVPNNAIWGGVITNATSTSRRRVDLVFGIGYEDDIAQAQAIMEKLVEADERILKDPAPTIKVNELADSSVNFVCRPWVKTADYWDVYWDLTRKVKEEFDANDISIPYPQQDIHVHHHAGEGGAPFQAPAGGK